MRIKISFILLLALFLAGCGQTERLQYVAPTVLSGTTREMQTAGFWIARHPYPDKVIMTPEEVDKFNAYIRDKLGSVDDLSLSGTDYSGVMLADSLEKDIDSVSRRHYYRRNGQPAEPGFFADLRQKMDFDDIPEDVTLQYGFLKVYADQRVLPTEEILTDKPLDIDFDELQNSSFDLGTPVVIYHTSKDGAWVYGKTATTIGWFKKDAVTTCPYDEFLSLVSKPVFCVVTSPKADIYLDPEMTKFYDHCRMGARLACKELPDKNTIEVIVPASREDGSFTEMTAYMDKKDVNIGYLPYTPRAVIEQAFRMLNQPYGWGGMNGEQDCSSFIQEIFATVGVILPRNSSSQAKVGRLIGGFTDKTVSERKIRALSRDAVGGITLLQLKGHIMLYIGMSDKKPYVVHDTRGYSQKVRSFNPFSRKDIARVINRVVLSDIFTGAGSKKRSLIERLLVIRILDKNL